jgi:hypothetical protein
MTNGMLRWCHSNSTFSILCHVLHAFPSDKPLVNYCIFIYFINFQKYYLKIKDDTDFNIHFFGIIEANPCIYNQSISDCKKKKKKNLIDNTWEEIL